MAKARDIPGLRWDDSFRTAAAAVVRVRAQELWEQADGVLDTSDVERVHAAGCGRSWRSSRRASRPPPTATCYAT